jgi:hypothetical protein
MNYKVGKYSIGVVTPVGKFNHPGAALNAGIDDLYSSFKIGLVKDRYDTQPVDFIEYFQTRETCHIFLPYKVNGCTYFDRSINASLWM